MVLNKVIFQNSDTDTDTRYTSRFGCGCEVHNEVHARPAPIHWYWYWCALGVHDIPIREQKQGLSAALVHREVGFPRWHRHTNTWTHNKRTLQLSQRLNRWTWVNIGHLGSKLVSMGQNKTQKTCPDGFKFVQLGPYRKFHFLLSQNRAKLGYPKCCWARAKPGSDYEFVTEPSQLNFFWLKPAW